MMGAAMDRLRAFEVFVAVVGQGGFTRAADKLDTSPPNVTRYVNDLEEALGVRLLNRTSRRLSLTETGKTLYDKALSILEDVAEAEAIASSAALQPRGRLRVNAPLSFGILHLAPLWPRFMTRYPDIELDISLVDRVVDLVEEGYDLAVRISRGGSPALVSRKLATPRQPEAPHRAPSDRCIAGLCRPPRRAGESRGSQPPRLHRLHLFGFSR